VLWDQLGAAATFSAGAVFAVAAAVLVVALRGSARSG
jgi:hypothetical protein